MLFVGLVCIHSSPPHTENCTTEEAYAFQKEYAASLGLPVLLPIQEGVTPIIPVLKSLMTT